MRLAIGKYTNMFYFIPTIIWLNKEPRLFALIWGRWYIGFDEKEK